MSIIDRRHQKSSKKDGDRKKFLDRHKESLRKQVDDIINKKRLKDIGQDSQRVKVPVGPLDEPTFVHDPNTGSSKKVHPGNTIFPRGQKIRKNKSSGASGSGSGGSPDGELEDTFEFLLSKKEFLEILFEGMALPNYVKKSLANDKTSKLVRAGYTTEGPMQKLNLLKTFQHSLARRLAFKGAIDEKYQELTEEERQAKKDKISFLEDVDLRFNLHQPQEFPLRKAVMFCVMDVSGSMTEYLKDLAKRFFLLLYLFIDKHYDHVDIRFIRHTQTAKEVSEQDFFYKRESGGTIVSSGFELVNDIIKKEYDLETWNVYVAQASDGENWSQDDEKLYCVLDDEILPKVQYMAYVEVVDPEFSSFNFGGSLFDFYEPLTNKYQHFNKAVVLSADGVFKALRGLFKDE